jgi:hypothetical protein
VGMTDQQSLGDIDSESGDPELDWLGHLQDIPNVGVPAGLEYWPPEVADLKPEMQMVLAAQHDSTAQPATDNAGVHNILLSHTSEDYSMQSLAYQTPLQVWFHARSCC